MKKVCLSLVLFVIAVSTSFAQKWFPLENNKAFELGVGGTAINTELGYAGAFNVSATLYGFYVDYSFNSPKHKSDIRVDKWKNEFDVSAFCVGYKFPITERFSIIPNVGVSTLKQGTVDGSKYTINSGHISNHFEVEKTYIRKDFGCILRFNICNKSTLHVNLDLKLNGYSQGGALVFCVPL